MSQNPALPKFEVPINDKGGATSKYWYFFFQGLLANALSPSGVVPGSYTSTNLTVNEDGIITAASDGSGGGAITVTDGTHTVTPASQITFAGAVVSGATPNAVVTIAGGGTVTSVALNDASTNPIYTISGSPVTTAGTLTGTLKTQAANIVFAGPASGGAVQPAFRAIVIADLPAFVSQNNVTADSHGPIPTGIGLGPNDEFETGATIDTTGSRYAGATPWTAFNLSTATNQVNAGALVLRPVNTVALTVNGYSQPIVGATWAYVAKVVSANLPTNGAVGAMVGLPGGKFIYFNVSGTGGAQMNVQAFTNPTTFSSTQIGLGSAIAIGNYVYLQILYNGTNIIFSYSYNGVPGSFVTAFTETPASFLGAVPTIVGLVGSLQSGQQGQLVCDWFRQIA